MSPKKRRATSAQERLEQAVRLVEQAELEVAGTLPPMHPAVSEVRDAILQLRRTIEVVRLAVRRIP